MMKPFLYKRIVLLCTVLFALSSASAQTPSQRSSVSLSANVQQSPPSIELNWSVHSGATSYTISRRTPGSAAWVSIGSAVGGSNSYTDNTVSVNTAYEYKVRRSGNGTGYGYVRSGIEVAASDMHYRGKMVLLVESVLGAQLTTELAQLEDDLIGDGWFPIRVDVSATQSAVSVRNEVLAVYNADPTRVKAVYIIGHVPVPYSGNLRPDGHTQHRGAWACDGYYGEMNGSWTDNSVNTSVSVTPWNHNTPGDGKFDQSDFNSAVELMVGRVHLGQLPAFGQTDVQLTQQYLNKAHAFKMRWWEHPATAAVYDNLSWVSNPLAGSAYQSAASWVGASNIVDINPNAQLWGTYSANKYLISYHSGSGTQDTYMGNTTFTGVGNGGSTADLASTDIGSVFNLSFGSYFGDWDNYNNYLRAVIAKGDGLVSVWSGIPNWFFHPMAMGEPVGYCARLAMNNTNTNYSLQNGGWQGQSYNRIHLGLMGDPSLRMRMVAPPTALVATNSSWYVDFTWTASPDPVQGYYVYKINDAAGEIELISPLVSGTSFTSTNVQFFPGDRYMVRAATLQTTASGTFENLSLASIALAAGTQIADCTGAIGGTDIPGNPCDDGDPTTGADTWNASCQCLGLLIDCAGTPGGAALPGTACDDGNAGTGNDMWDANCICEGTIIDCVGVIGGPALPGTACDDGNSDTGNDQWNASCVCEGQVIDCEGIIGGPALPGVACDDGDSTTVNDVWTSTCDCAGSPVGIDEILGSSFELFPNPASSYVIIRTEQSVNGTIIFTDLLGKEVFRDSFLGVEKRLDLRSISVGTYLVQIKDRQGIHYAARAILLH